MGKKDTSSGNKEHQHFLDSERLAGTPRNSNNMEVSYFPLLSDERKRDAAKKTKESMPGTPVNSNNVKDYDFTLRDAERCDAEGKRRTMRENVMQQRKQRRACQGF